MPSPEGGGIRWANVCKQPLTWLATLATLSPRERAVFPTSATPCPALDLLFPADGGQDVTAKFVKHEPVDVVACGESGDEFALVFNNPPFQVVRHARVEGARLAGHWAGWGELAWRGQSSVKEL